MLGARREGAWVAIPARPPSSTETRNCTEGLIAARASRDLRKRQRRHARGLPIFHSDSYPTACRGTRNQTRSRSAPVWLPVRRVRAESPGSGVFGVLGARVSRCPTGRRRTSTICAMSARRMLQCSGGSRDALRSPELGVSRFTYDVRALRANLDCTAKPPVPRRSR